VGRLLVLLETGVGVVLTTGVGVGVGAGVGLVAARGVRARERLCAGADVTIAAPDKHSAAIKWTAEHLKRMLYSNLTETSLETPTSSIVTP
jgi:hypothetical protein